MNQNNIWYTLGIEKTADKEAIKAAYAAKAKQFHPEEHPEEFQELQRAYKSAIKYAKGEKSTKVNKVNKIYAENLKNEESLKQQQVSVSNEEVKQHVPVSVEPIKQHVPLSAELVKQKVPVSAETIKQTVSISNEPTKQNVPLSAEPIKQKTPIHNEPTKQKVPVSNEPIKQKTPEPQTPLKPEKEQVTSYNEPSDNKVTNDEPVIDFDYGDVETGESEKQFFSEFVYIAKNGYIINNTTIWRCLLENPEYSELFYKSDFEYNIVKTMCGIAGWNKTTIQFFEEYFGQNKSSETLKYYKKLMRFRGFKQRAFRSEQWVVVEQQDFHKAMISHVKNMCGNDNLENMNSAKCYMDIYLEYAKNNSKKIHKYYKQGVIFSRVIFCVGIVFFTLAYLANFVWR